MYLLGKKKIKDFLNTNTSARVAVVTWYKSFNDNELKKKGSNSGNGVHYLTCYLGKDEYVVQLTYSTIIGSGYIEYIGTASEFLKHKNIQDIIPTKLTGLERKIKSGGDLNREVKSESEYKALYNDAIWVIGSGVSSNPSYEKLLSSINNYEVLKYSLSTVTIVEVLKYEMSLREETIQDVATIFGTVEEAQEYLSGTKEFTNELFKALCKHYKSLKLFRDQ